MALKRSDRNLNTASPIRIWSLGLMGIRTARSSRSPLSNVPLVLVSITNARSVAASNRISRWLRETPGSSITSRRCSAMPAHTRPTKSWSKIGTMLTPPSALTMRWASGSSGQLASTVYNLAAAERRVCFERRSRGDPARLQGGVELFEVHGTDRRDVGFDHGRDLRVE